MTTPSGTPRGILFMVIGSALLTANDALSKWLTAEYPVAQVWCLRALAAMALILVMAPRYGGYRCLRPRRLLGQSVRAAMFVSTTVLIVWGLSLMPLVDMEAVVFSSPLFIAMLSPYLLGERVSAHRWVGAGAGFVGVLLILRPGTGVLGGAALVALGAALSSALRDIVTRRIGRSEHPLAILCFSNAAVLVVGFGVAPWFDWRAIAPRDWGLLVLNGLFNVGAHFLVIEALRLAEVAAVAPYKYSALLWGVLLGMLVFGEFPDAMTWTGALLVTASGLYILRREQGDGAGAQANGQRR